MTSIYMDNHATTPLDPRVLAGMQPYLSDAFGNPSSQTHQYGWQAEAAVEKARKKVAQFLGASDPNNILFTSGATESNNLAILGTLKGLNQACHIIVGATEHKAVLEVAQVATQMGHDLTVLGVDEFGCVELDRLARAVRPDTKLVSIMWANNEIGSINPIEEIAKFCHDREIFFHTDAAQAAGKVAINVDQQKISMLSISGHKMYGPKGVGALFVDRRQVPLKPLFYGGSQEFGLRPGTHNVPGIVGLGIACELAANEMTAETARLKEWRDKIILAATSNNQKAKLNGHPIRRLCNNVSVSLANLAGDLFSCGFEKIACSSGSACTSGTGQISHVLKAIGRDDRSAKLTLRLGLGRFTSQQDVDATVKALLELEKSQKQS